MSDETIADQSGSGEIGTPGGVLKQDGAIIVDGMAVVMTREAYAELIGYRASKPLSLTARFAQGTWWRMKTGEWRQISDMTPGHRYNTAAMLMRTAENLALRHAFAFAGVVDEHDGGDMAHASLEGIADDLAVQAVVDPRGWLRETALYKALTAGLTITGDGTEPWQKTGRDPVTGEPTEVPPIMTRVCEIPACGCSGEAHA
jgi:hypothetical protein